MENIRINEKKLKQYKKLHPDFHSESELYINGDDLLKILISPEDKRINTIEKLSQINDSNFVTPKYGIIDTKSNKLCGYGMKYYKEFISLSKYITENNLTFSQRKILSIRICEILKKLQSYDFIYYDIHSDNILIKDDNIKVIDLDGGFFSSDNSMNYDFIVNDAKNYTCDLCFQIMMGIDMSLDKFTESKKKRLIGLCENEYQRVFIMHALNASHDYVEPLHYVDKINEDYTMVAKKVLINNNKTI